MNYRSLNDLNSDMRNGLSRIPKEVDLIVGIPRSGMIAASILSVHLNCPLIDFSGYIEGKKPWAGRTKKKSRLLNNALEACCPLIIDDSLRSGGSMEEVRQVILEHNLPGKHLFAAVYTLPGKESKVDISFRSLGLPRVFEWNLMHSSTLSRSCVDIDGVLCRDPVDSENDDGDNYKKFISSTPAIFQPSHEIGWLVTSRLEKYRTETEKWLASNNICYRNLMMLDVPSAEVRRRLRLHASFKGEVYSQCDAVLFIESSSTQAQTIAEISGKPTLSFDTGDLIWPGGMREYGSKMRSRAPAIWHRLITPISSKVRSWWR
ncbi:MAG: phosphoribosyltransferase [Planctomycetes bacterium]|nr:phosphoribosyltransferase [Planctomycetota bacterium]